MLDRLDDDSLTNIILFLPISDFIDGLAMINSRMFKLNLSDREYLLDLIREKILQEHDLDLLGLLYDLDKALVIESLLNEEEKKLINCGVLQELFQSCQSSTSGIKNSLQVLKEVDSCEKIRICVECCNRLEYLRYCWKNEKNDFSKPFEMLYNSNRVDNSVKYSKFCREFLQLATKYSLSPDRIYKFKLCYVNKKMKVLKLYSKSLSERQDKDISLKDYKEAFTTLLNKGELEVGSLDYHVLLQQEEVDNNVTLSTFNIQSSEYYRKGSLNIHGVTKVEYLHKSNALFHALSEPYKCGDLKFSKIRKVVFCTLSRTSIKQMLSPYLIYSIPFFPLATYVLLNHVNYTFGWSSGVNPLLTLFDVLLFSFISLATVDHCVNHFGRISQQLMGYGWDLIRIFMLLKLLTCIIISPLTGNKLSPPFFKTFEFSIPFMFTAVPLIYGVIVYPRALWWYVRASDWFYSLIEKKEDEKNVSLFKRFNRFIFSKIGNIGWDTKERCRID